MIRKLKASDVEQVVPLIMIILDDMELPFLKTYGAEKVTEVLKEGFKEESFRYGYKRGIAVEESGEILGVAFGYLAEDEAIIDRVLPRIYRQLGIPESAEMFTDKEAFANEWYLDSIAVRADARGQGVGAELLAALPKFATDKGNKKIGLSVDDDNPRAKALYLRQGFEWVGRATISGHDYDHLQKII